MRVPAIGCAFDRLDDDARGSRALCLGHARSSRKASGAQATAAATFSPETVRRKPTSSETIEERFGYDLSPSIDSPASHLPPSTSRARGHIAAGAHRVFSSPPVSKTQLRKAISLGGDADTLACITGGVAEAHYGGVPDTIAARALAASTRRCERSSSSFRLATDARPAEAWLRPARTTGVSGVQRPTSNSTACDTAPLLPTSADETIGVAECDGFAAASP